LPGEQDPAVNGGTRSGVRAVLARWRGRDIELKSPGEIDAMRVAGALVAQALAAVTAAARSGVSTGELDAIAEQVIRDGGGVPSFLGYHGFPASICASLNEQIVHGIPAPTQVLADGDLLSVDCGAIVEGWHGDAAVTFAVGTGTPTDLALSAACREALHAGIAAVRPGARLSDVSHAVQTATESAGRRDGVSYGIVEEYGGHGIGTQMHQAPHVLNYRTRSRGPKLKPGICLAIEPMLTIGEPETRVQPDQWTVVTVDGSRAAHWEHTVALTDRGPWVLTARDGGEQALGTLGVKVVPLGD
jgi:methionyl aminopeptidase